MRFLQILFWVVFIVLAIIFSVNNWTLVEIPLGDDSILETKLPVLVIGSFLIGFLPLYFWHRITTWRLKRKINAAQNTPRNPPLNMSEIPNNKPHAGAGISPLEPKSNLESE